MENPIKNQKVRFSTNILPTALILTKKTSIGSAPEKKERKHQIDAEAFFLGFISLGFASLFGFVVISFIMAMMK